jgi:hypothetical protein
MNIHSTTYSGKHKHKGYMKYYITSATLAIVLAGYFSINTPTTYVEDNKKVVIASILESKPTFKDEILGGIEEQNKNYLNKPLNNKNKAKNNLSKINKKSEQEILDSDKFYIDNKGKLIFIDSNIPEDSNEERALV